MFPATAVIHRVCLGADASTSSTVVPKWLCVPRLPFSGSWNAARRASRCHRNIHMHQYAYSDRGRVCVRRSPTGICFSLPIAACDRPVSFRMRAKLYSPTREYANVCAVDGRSSCGGTAHHDRYLRVPPPQAPYIPSSRSGFPSPGRGNCRQTIVLAFRGLPFIVYPGPWRQSSTRPLQLTPRISRHISEHDFSHSAR